MPHPVPSEEQLPDEVFPIFIKTADRPGEVFHAKKIKQWISDQDPVYVEAMARAYPPKVLEFDTVAQAIAYLEKTPVRDRHGLGPSPPRSTLLASEMLAVLTAQDIAEIELAIDAEKDQARADKAAGRIAAMPLSLLWSSTKAHGGQPIHVSNAWFQAGWSALGQVLGSQRIAEISAALKIA